MCKTVNTCNVVIVDNNSERVDKYMNVLTSAGLVSGLNILNRVVDDCRSCIDHVFENLKCLDKVRAGVIHTLLTDHSPLYLLLGNTTTRFDEDVARTYIDCMTFRRPLRGQHWTSVTDNRDLLVLQRAAKCHAIVADIVN